MMPPACGWGAGGLGEGDCGGQMLQLIRAAVDGLLDHHGRLVVVGPLASGGQGTPSAQGVSWLLSPWLQAQQGRIPAFRAALGFSHRDQQQRRTFWHGSWLVFITNRLYIHPLLNAPPGRSDMVAGRSVC